jgi:hypothetical protein
MVGGCFSIKQRSMRLDKVLSCLALGINPLPVTHSVWEAMMVVAAVEAADRLSHRAAEVVGHPLIALK